jgi:hypothetical protein
LPSLAVKNPAVAFSGTGLPGSSWKRVLIVHFGG